MAAMAEPSFWERLAAAWLAKERQRVGLPQAEAAELAARKGRMDIEKMAREEMLAREFAGPEREARLEDIRARTAHSRAETSYEEERAALARETLEARKEIAALQASGRRDPATQQRLDALRIRLMELNIADPYRGKYPPPPIIVQGATGTEGYTRWGAPWNFGGGDPYAGAPGHPAVSAPGGPQPSSTPASPSGLPTGVPGTGAGTAPGVGAGGGVGLPPNVRPPRLPAAVQAMQYARAQIPRMFRGMAMDIKAINTGNVAEAATLPRQVWAQMQVRFKTDPRTRMYADNLRGFVPLLARAVGHVGVLTELDVQRTEALFPQPGDSEVFTRNKLRRVFDIMQGRATMPFQYEEQTGRLTTRIVYPAVVTQPEQ